MQATEDGLRGHELAFGQLVTMGLRFGWDSRRGLGNGTQCSVRPSAVVVRGPFTRDRAQVRFAQRNDPVEALAAKGSNQPLAEGVRLGTARWRLEPGEADELAAVLEDAGPAAEAVLLIIGERACAEELAGLFEGARLADCSGIIRRLRAVKSAWEIARFRLAARRTQASCCWCDRRRPTRPARDTTRSGSR